jgi:hypothetical protein
MCASSRGIQPRNRWEAIMKIARVLGILTAIALTGAACADDADLDADLDTEPAAETTPAPAPVTPADEMPDHTLTLQSLGGSGVTGEVEIDEDGDRLEVDVQLRNSTASAVHKGHIHTGTCDSPGEVVTPLEDITIGDDGEGSSENEVEVSMQTLAAGPHIVAYHEANGAPGAPVVCAAIPSAPAN